MGRHGSHGRQAAGWRAAMRIGAAWFGRQACSVVAWTGGGQPGEARQASKAWTATAGSGQSGSATDRLGSRGEVWTCGSRQVGSRRGKGRLSKALQVRNVKAGRTLETSRGKPGWASTGWERSGPARQACKARWTCQAGRGMDRRGVARQDRTGAACCGWVWPGADGQGVKSKTSQRNSHYAQSLRCIEKSY